jgi:chaperonin GroEL
LVVNRARGVLKACAVKAPGFGDRRKAMLEDLAILTSGQVISADLGLTVEKVPIESLGKAKRVVITKDKTTIVQGEGKKSAVAGRLEQLRRERKLSTSDYDREKLDERIAKLSGGVAVIRVGASSEVELKNRKDSFDDAINATRAAMAEGVVPGAGLAFLRAIGDLEREEAKADGDEKTGMRILRTTLEVPTRQLAENAGVDGGVVVDRMRSGTGAFGFDASRRAYGDLVEAGIIDPVKVLRVGLENAVATASVLLLTEATLTEIPEKEEKHGPGMESEI